MSTFDRLLISTPINGAAARVVSQRRTSQEDTPLSRAELLEIQNRLLRKHRLLKHILRIKNASQHRNLIYKKNKGFVQYRAKAEPRAFVEYVRLGVEVQRFNEAICEAGVRERAAMGVQSDEEWNALTPEEQQAIKQRNYDEKTARGAAAVTQPEKATS